MRQMSHRLNVPGGSGSFGVFLKEGCFKSMHLLTEPPLLSNNGMPSLAFVAVMPSRVTGCLHISCRQATTEAAAPPLRTSASIRTNSSSDCRNLAIVSRHFNWISWALTNTSVMPTWFLHPHKLVVRLQESGHRERAFEMDILGFDLYQRNADLMPDWLLMMSRKGKR